MYDLRVLDVLLGHPHGFGSRDAILGLFKPRGHKDTSTPGLPARLQDPQVPLSHEVKLGVLHLPLRQDLLHMRHQVLCPWVRLAVRHGAAGGPPLGTLVVLPGGWGLAVVPGRFGVVVQLVHLFLLLLILLVLLSGSELGFAHVRLVRLRRSDNINCNQDLPLRCCHPLQLGARIVRDDLIDSQQLSLTDAQRHLDDVLPMHGHLGGPPSASDDSGAIDLAQEPLEKSNAFGKLESFFEVLHLRWRSEVKTHREKIVAVHVSTPHTVVQVRTKPALGGVLGISLKIVRNLTGVQLVKISYLGLQDSIFEIPERTVRVLVVHPPSRFQTLAQRGEPPLDLEHRRLRVHPVALLPIRQVAVHHPRLSAGIV
mmetsp:Transcript_7038/g.17396  ORF Transcript_7038/g.17396 Transcript_7038/m.17396 type:complete len:369 (-) Transcript_7038:108-1214(-)